VARLIVIGAGPAAAAVALAAKAQGGHDVVVIDIGERLDADRMTMIDGVADLHPSQWPADVTDVLTRQPVPELEGELPQKQQFGSDYAFRNKGQIDAYAVQRGGNRYPISGAFGGFSNVWGAQIMPFSRATIDQWPINYDELTPHYRSILAQIPFAGIPDDYEELFPLLGEPTPLPPLAPNSQAVLDHYGRRREWVRSRGVTAAAARLALRARECVLCNNCLTGCPYHLIYSASHTFQQLLRAGAVDYRPGLLALRVGEGADGAWVEVKDLSTGEISRISGDRVFVGAGGLGSTRLALNSARPGVRTLELGESVQVVLPFLSRRAGPDVHDVHTFTLNQFNLLVEYGRAGLDMAHFHLYPFNPAFEDALPGPIKRSPRLTRAILRRTSAALGYLPSWDSPRLRLEISPALGEGRLPAVVLSAIPNPRTKTALARVFSRLLAVGPALDLYPALPAMSVSGPGKSYHFGGSFPHVPRAPREGALETDTLGRLAEWDRVHLVDGAVFPTVPATTFTLTVMANAHRIASTVLGNC
jgi:hypothetical protein